MRNLLLLIEEKYQEVDMGLMDTLYSNPQLRKFVYAGVIVLLLIAFFG